MFQTTNQIPYHPQIDIPIQQVSAGASSLGKFHTTSTGSGKPCHTRSWPVARSGLHVRSRGAPPGLITSRLFCQQHKLGLDDDWTMLQNVIFTHINTKTPSNTNKYIVILIAV